ncbi:MAG: hypothetical protein WCB51_12135, partial [Candidatus Dormiibacterota bacterium]
PWSRPRDHTLTETEHAATGFEAPPPAPDAAVDDTAATQEAPTWSVIEPGTSHAHWPAPAPTETPADEHDTAPVATGSLGEVEAAAAPETAEGEATSAAETAAGVDTSADEPAHAEAAHETEAPSEDAAHENEDAAHEAPAAAAATAWYAREVIADSVSRYEPTQHAEVSSEAAADAEHGAAAEHEAHAVHSAAEDSEVGTVAEADHASRASEGAEEAPIGATEHEPAAEEDLGHVAEAHPETEEARNFWAEFATPDDHAEDAEPEPEVITASDATAGTAAHADDTAAHTEEESDAAPEPASESGHESAAEDAEPWKRAPSERTFAPWSWPLAEAETLPSPAARPAPIVDETSDHVGAEAATGSAHLDTEADIDSGAEQGFFQRDEPVGSQFVDFDEVRQELVQIGVMWLGERNAVPVTALLTKTRSTIDDFVATIDTIRGLHIEGQDPASIQAMAREMHQQAAERLCGA